MHVEDQVDGLVVVNQPAQHQPRQEGLARAGLAEDAVGALGKADHVEADLRVHVEWVADAEVAALGVALAAEYLGHVFGHGLLDLGEVARNGLDRTRAFFGCRVLGHHQHGPQRDDVVRAGAGEHLAQQRIFLARRMQENLLVVGVEAHVGDHGEKVVFVALNDHELAGLHVLDILLGVQLHLHPLDQRAFGNHSDLLAATGRGWHSVARVFCHRQLTTRRIIELSRS